jgi:murein DD-endopeptidase MepM/ murein hydrolase activator NlpD
LSGFNIEHGQMVKKGDLIGFVGSTGRSTGAHLHYGVNIDGKWVNPLAIRKSSDYSLEDGKN